MNSDAEHSKDSNLSAASNKEKESGNLENGSMETIVKIKRKVSQQCLAAPGFSSIVRGVYNKSKTIPATNLLVTTQDGGSSAGHCHPCTASGHLPWWLQPNEQWSSFPAISPGPTLILKIS